MAIGMTEYIEREALLCMVQPDDPSDEKAAITIATAKKLIRNIVSRTPAADVAPVRHGWWIDKGEYAACTECDGRSGTQYDGVEPIPLTTQFCPHCGAKMDEVMNDENKKG